MKPQTLALILTVAVLGCDKHESPGGTKTAAPIAPLGSTARPPETTPAMPATSRPTSAATTQPTTRPLPKLDLYDVKDNPGWGLPEKLSAAAVQELAAKVDRLEPAFKAWQKRAGALRHNYRAMANLRDKLWARMRQRGFRDKQLPLDWSKITTPNVDFSFLGFPEEMAEETLDDVFGDAVKQRCDTARINLLGGEPTVGDHLFLDGLDLFIQYMDRELSKEEPPVQDWFQRFANEFDDCDVYFVTPAGEVQHLTHVMSEAEIRQFHERFAAARAETDERAARIAREKRLTEASEELATALNANQLFWQLDPTHQAKVFAKISSALSQDERKLFPAFFRDIVKSHGVQLVGEVRDDMKLVVYLYPGFVFPEEKTPPKWSDEDKARIDRVQQGINQLVIMNMRVILNAKQIGAWRPEYEKEHTWMRNYVAVLPKDEQGQIVQTINAWLQGEKASGRYERVFLNNDLTVRVLTPEEVQAAARAKQLALQQQQDEDARRRAEQQRENEQRKQNPFDPANWKVNIRIGR